MLAGVSFFVNGFRWIVLLASAFTIPMRWHSGTIGRRSATSATVPMATSPRRMPTAAIPMDIVQPSTSTSSTSAATTTASTAGPFTVRHRNTSRPVATTAVMMAHPPQRVHRAPQRVLDPPCWGLLRVRAGRVDGAALDEHAHEDNEQDAHQAHHVPVLRDPLGNGLKRLAVE